MGIPIFTTGGLEAFTTAYQTILRRIVAMVYAFRQTAVFSPKDGGRERLLKIKQQQKNGTVT